MSESLKAVFVNSAARKIEDVEIRTGLKAMYDMIGCRLVDLVRLPDGDDLFVDDEGLLGIEPTSPMFRIGDLTLAGNGVIIGGNDDTGESCSAHHDAAHYRERITFTHASADAMRKMLRESLESGEGF